MRGAKRRRVNEWIAAETARLRKELEQLPVVRDGGIWWQEVQLKWLSLGTPRSFGRAKKRMRNSKMTVSQRKRWFEKGWHPEHSALRKAYGSKQRPRR